MRILFLVLVPLLLQLGCQSPALTSAKLYLQEEQPEKAKEQLLLALEQDPANAEAHFLLGQIYGTEGEYALMTEAFDQSLAVTPRFQAEIDRYRQHYWTREYNNGVVRVSDEPPDLKSARVFFRRAAHILPDRLEAWRNLAYVYYQLDSLDAATATYRQIIHKDPADTNSHYSLGVILLGQQQPAAAAEIFGQLLALDPEHFDGLINLAVAQTQLEDYAAAEVTYNRAIAVQPDSPHCYYNLGNLYWKQDQYAQAAEAFAEACRLDPEDNEARFNLAVSYLSLDELDKALPLLEQLSVAMPDRLAVWRELGRIYAIKGMLKKSQAAYDRAEALGG